MDIIESIYRHFRGARFNIVSNHSEITKQSDQWLTLVLDALKFILLEEEIRYLTPAVRNR